MGRIQDARDAGFDHCLEEMGMDKVAFLGALMGAGRAAVGGARLASKAIGAGWRGTKAVASGIRSASQKAGLTGTKQVGSVNSGVGKSIPKFDPKLQKNQILQNRRQYMQGDQIMQKGRINGATLGTKVSVVGGAGLMGAESVGGRLNARLAGNRAVLNRVPRSPNLRRY